MMRTRHRSVERCGKTFPVSSTKGYFVDATIVIFGLFFLLAIIPATISARTIRRGPPTNIFPDPLRNCSTGWRRGFRPIILCHPAAEIILSALASEGVLIIGGGDGGVAREVIKDQRVEHVDLCEIDERVVEVSKQFLPSMAVGFRSDRVRVVFEDGAKFLAETAPETYDVIIADSSDPDGPAESLFQGEFYKAVGRVLKPGGIVCFQGESMWLHVDIIKRTLGRVREHFPVVSYASAYIPTYPGGQIGFVIAAKDEKKNLSDPVWVMSDAEMTGMKLKYYSPGMHKAAFILPRDLEKKLELVH
ncbi:unnamed protein product [Notodromas monacha]|uniref:PABS domain-containing protein n=1 Tax=Notodromas monacha TaxID=399045 RepID=A0A7R9GHU4_9CRUS|nr:unnamed protein product [Notodromas monacha]CAG0923273.1 unnamed protein product [Notodromas monacha]